MAAEGLITVLQLWAKGHDEQARGRGEGKGGMTVFARIDHAADANELEDQDCGRPQRQSATPRPARR
jgi:hypothetical protein